MVLRRTQSDSPNGRRWAVPEAVRRRTEDRLARFAALQFAGRYTRLDIRFRGQFCYVDAYTEPEPSSADWLPPGGRETREEYLERLRTTPVHLCRLRYSGYGDLWGFAFYTYSHERYEPSFLPSGAFLGTPEEAFEVSAAVYLQ